MGNTSEDRRVWSISLKWHGHPLVHYKVIVNVIAATTIRKGLTVRADIDPAQDETGMKLTDAELATIRMARDDFHGEWNFIISLNR